MESSTGMWVSSDREEMKGFREIDQADSEVLQRREWVSLRQRERPVYNVPRFGFVPG